MTILAFVANVLLVTSFSFMFSLIPLVLGAGTWKAFMLFNLSLTVSAFYTPFITHKLGGSKKTAMLFLAAHCVCYALLFTDQHELAWALNGLVFGPAQTSLDVILRSYTTKDKQLKLIGWFTGISAATSAAAIPLGKWILERSQSLWIGAGIAATIVIMLLIAGLPAPALSPTEKKARGVRNLTNILRLSVFSLTYSLSAPLVFVALRIFFLSEVSLALATFCSGLASVILPLVYPHQKLADQYYYLLGAGMALLTVSVLLIIIGSPNHELLLGIAGLLIGVTVGGGKLCHRAKLSSRKESDLESTTAFHLNKNLPGMIFPLPLSLIAEWRGENRDVWWSILVILFLSAIGLAMQSWWEKKKRGRPS